MEQARPGNLGGIKAGKGLFPSSPLFPRRRCPNFFLPHLPHPLKTPLWRLGGLLRFYGSVFWVCGGEALWGSFGETQGGGRAGARRHTQAVPLLPLFQKAVVAILFFLHGCWALCLPGGAHPPPGNDIGLGLLGISSKSLSWVGGSSRHPSGVLGGLLPRGSLTNFSPSLKNGSGKKGGSTPPKPAPGRPGACGPAGIGRLWPLLAGGFRSPGASGGPWCRDYLSGRPPSRPGLLGNREDIMRTPWANGGDGTSNVIKVLNPRGFSPKGVLPPRIRGTSTIIGAGSRRAPEAPMGGGGVGNNLPRGVVFGARGGPPPAGEGRGTPPPPPQGGVVPAPGGFRGAGGPKKRGPKDGGVTMRETHLPPGAFTPLGFPRPPLALFILPLPKGKFSPLFVLVFFLGNPRPSRPSSPGEKGGAGRGGGGPGEPKPSSKTPRGALPGPWNLWENPKSGRKGPGEGPCPAAPAGSPGGGKFRGPRGRRPLFGRPRAGRGGRRGRPKIPRRGGRPASRAPPCLLPLGRAPRALAGTPGVGGVKSPGGGSNEGGLGRGRVKGGGPDRKFLFPRR